MRFVAFFPLCLLLGGVAHAQPETLPRWRVDSASVTFEITNAGLPVRGRFTGLEAEVRFDPADPVRSLIHASVDASTVDTGIRLRDKHLRKRAYFHVERYPRIHMTSLYIAWRGDGVYLGTFRLTVKGAGRVVAFPFTLASDGRRGRLTGRFTVNRLHFSVGEPSAILADEVTVDLVVDVTRIDP